MSKIIDFATRSRRPEPQPETVAARWEETQEPFAAESLVAAIKVQVISDDMLAEAANELRRQADRFARVVDHLYRAANGGKHLTDLANEAAEAEMMLQTAARFVDRVWRAPYCSR
jgi:hypothetical protein